MKGTPAVYLGKIVEKENFRVFVYGPNGEQRLVESWDEFESCMESGLWFAKKEHAIAIKEDAIAMTNDEEGDLKPKAKNRAKPKPKAKKVEEVQEGEIAADVLDDMVYEVKD